MLAFLHRKTLQRRRGWSIQLSSWPTSTLWLVLLLARLSSAQILDSRFSPCLSNAQQAPSNELLNITHVYAQLDVSGSSAQRSSTKGSTNGSLQLEDAQGQALLRLVARADTGSQQTGFSNVTNYLSTLIAETSLLSFLPYSNQTSLCSSIITSADGNSSPGVANTSASSYPDPGGCPYGPGPVLIGYTVPLGQLSEVDFYSLTTLSTRLRILDTSVPPLQLACVDVYTTPYYFNDATDSWTFHDTARIVPELVLWVPAALLIAYTVINVIARLYSACTSTRQEREAAIAASLTAKLSAATRFDRIREVFLETAVGRSIVRSRSLTRFTTPGVGDVLVTLQWIVLVGMCSVRWHSFIYPLFARLGWTMLIFDTTLITPASEHPVPSASLQSYPPADFKSNSDTLFTSRTSPFYFSNQATSNLLNLPSTLQYDAASVPSYYPPANEVDGIASWSSDIGLLPQHLFANCLTFFAIILAVTIAFTLVVPFIGILLARMLGGTKTMTYRVADKRGSTSSLGEGADAVPRPRLISLGSERAVSAQSKRHSEHRSSIPSTYKDTGPYSPGTAGDQRGEYMPSVRGPSRESRHGRIGSQGINQWWARGDKAGHEDEYEHHAEHDRDDSSLRTYLSFGSWLALAQGSVLRLVMFFHLPITTFSVYQLAHASSTSSTITVIFAALVLVIFSLAIPVLAVLKIRRSMLRYLQDDTNTLLAYGPIYNTYAQDSYTFAAVRFTANLVEGCVVGGAQNRATVQVAVILVVEVIETLITSIWLPWGDGAAQGPLQFVLSVSRIITAVLLIVLSPSVAISFTARGWICYVILVVQAVVVVILFLILIAKIIELFLRLVWGVAFDESRSSKVGGIFGVFRKKGVLGFYRPKSIRKSSRHAGQTKGRAQGLSTESERPAMRDRHSSAGTGSQTGYLSQSSRLPRRALSPQEEDDEGGYIMSAWDRTSEAGYVRPGAYSAPQPAQAKSGFSVVRGGRATDEAPFTLQQHGLPPGAAARPENTRNQSYMAESGPPGQAESITSSMRRARAASQSAVVEFFQNGEISPSAEPSRRESHYGVVGDISMSRDGRRRSAPLPTSPRIPSPTTRSRRPVSGTDWKRESSSGSNFFTGLFKTVTSKSIDADGNDWSDSDDSDVETLARSRRKWPFSKNKRGKSSSDAVSMKHMQAGTEQHAHNDEEDEEIRAWQEASVEDEETGSAGPSTGKSFVVMRQPMPR